MSQVSEAYPEELKYTREHEWVALDGDVGTVGLTQYAQSELGDIVYVTLPEVGSVIVAGEEFGSVESVKAVSEVYAPAGGAVLETNPLLSDKPETVNSDPYGEGWLIRIRFKDPGKVSELMSATEYRNFLQPDAH